MGRQVGFYALERDQVELLGAFQEDGFVALPSMRPPGPAPAGVPPLEYRLPADETFFLLAPRGIAVAPDAWQSMTTPTPALLLMGRLAPVIEVTPSRLEGEVLREGRLYFETERAVAGHDVARKQFDKLARRIRTWPKTDQFSFHVAPHAARETAAGRIRLCHARYELQVI